MMPTTLLVTGVDHVRVVARAVRLNDANRGGGGQTGL